MLTPKYYFHQENHLQFTRFRGINTISQVVTHYSFPDGKLKKRVRRLLSCNT